MYLHIFSSFFPFFSPYLFPPLPLHNTFFFFFFSFPHASHQEAKLKLWRWITVQYIYRKLVMYLKSYFNYYFNFPFTYPAIPLHLSLPFTRWHIPLSLPPLLSSRFITLPNRYIFFYAFSLSSSRIRPPQLSSSDPPLPVYIPHYAPHSPTAPLPSPSPLKRPSLTGYTWQEVCAL